MKRLFVGRLDKSTSTSDVEHVFSVYGKLSRCEMKYGREHAFAFVDFENDRDAEDAKHGENGKKLCGAIMVVEWSRGRNASRGGGMMGYRGRGGPYMGGGGGGGGMRDDCYTCGRRGHFSRDCPEAGYRGGFRRDERSSRRRRDSRSYSRSRSKSRSRSRRRSRSPRGRSSRDRSPRDRSPRDRSPRDRSPRGRSRGSPSPKRRSISS